MEDLSADISLVASVAIGYRRGQFPTGCAGFRVLRDHFFAASSGQRCAVPGKEWAGSMRKEAALRSNLVRSSRYRTQGSTAISWLFGLTGLVLLGGLYFLPAGDRSTSPSGWIPAAHGDDLFPREQGLRAPVEIGFAPKQQAAPAAQTPPAAQEADKPEPAPKPVTDNPVAEEPQGPDSPSAPEVESDDAPAEGRRGRRGGGRRRGGEAGESSDSAEAPEARRKQPPAPGIPVTNQLVIERCSPCHEQDDRGHLSRISYERKTPEMWEMTLKRMIRLFHVSLEPQEAKEVVRYLANDHGLTREEAEQALYETERRLHWSEEDEEEDLRETCGKCHTLGRVFSERRSKEEWNLLKATHLAMYPLADFQAFRGRRGRNTNWGSMTESEAEDARERSQQRPSSDRADAVLAKLAERLPLFSESWKEWEVNRREVPLAATWTILGHEISRGDVRGTATFTRLAPDEYETEWNLRYGDGRQVVRKGRGLVYAGYSWRGRSETTAPREAPELREVLLLDETWGSMRGRIFTGEHNEFGIDVTLHRRVAEPRIFGADDAAVMIPSTGHRVLVHGSGFPEDLSAEDFHLGDGVTVTAARRGKGGWTAELTVDVAEGTDPGYRMISYGAVRGPQAIILYDTIDYIKIIPEDGFARVGGEIRPKQHERFEAVACHRGPDKKMWTDDDIVVHGVEAKFALAEFPIREGDDDVQYVGVIDADSGVFTPAVDGPNPQRRFKANNIGDVYVVATCSLTVPERIQIPQEEKSDEAESKDAASEKDADSEDEKTSTEPKFKEGLGPPVEKEFKARAHLIVSVPIYIDWNRYEWDER